MKDKLMEKEIKENVERWMSIPQSDEDLIGMFFGKCMDMGSEVGGLMSFKGLQLFNKYIIAWKKALLTSEVEKERERLLNEVEEKVKEQKNIIEDEMTGNQEASGYYVSGVSRMENGVRKALSDIQVNKKI